MKMLLGLFFLLQNGTVQLCSILAQDLQTGKSVFEKNKFQPDKTLNNIMFRFSCLIGYQPYRLKSNCFEGLPLGPNIKSPLWYRGRSRWIKQRLGPCQAQINPVRFVGVVSGPSAELGRRDLVNLDDRVKFCFRSKFYKRVAQALRLCLSHSCIELSPKFFTNVHINFH